MTRAQNKRLREKFESKYYPKIKKALADQISSFTDDLKKGGINYARAHLSMTAFNEKIGNVLRRLYVEAGVYKANRLNVQLRTEPRRQKRQTFGSKIAAYILESLRKYMLVATSKISETTRKEIERIIPIALEERWSIEKIVRELQSAEFTRMRARMIVRTETVRALNNADQAAMENYTYETQKEWVAVHDSRTRHSHLRVDSEVIDSSGVFSNGLRFPGDPEGRASQTINCRCFMNVKGKRDSEGRLIPKQNPGVRIVNRRQRNVIEDLISEFELT